ncbi:cupin domain-containing protein [Sciscionella sediminilitoris]|uniref:cupin domain-containing protein n=1 Tax=Sciscionella sediminilitoris TaxID=1445613 RepID=UPI00068D8BC1|nr:cupin domain-containing protein [Sciscionella sp. SE31]
MAESQRSIITEVGSWPLDGLPGKEIRLLTVEYPAGVHTPPHRHPGWQLIYVLEGKVTSRMEGEPVQQYEVGQHWFEPREHLHLDAGNDTEERAKVLVAYVTEPGQPILVPEV